MSFFGIYIIGVLVCFLLVALIAGIAGESDPDVLGPFGTIIVLWPVVLALGLLAAPFIGAWFVGDWIRRRFHS